MGLIRKTLLAGSAVTVLLAGTAGCGGSGHAAYHDALTCRTLATAARQDTVTGDYGNGLSAQAIVLAREAVAKKGYLSPQMRRDARAVVGTGLGNPSQAAVNRLQADCAAVHVDRPVWPTALTGN